MTAIENLNNLHFAPNLIYKNELQKNVCMLYISVSKLKCVRKYTKIIIENTFIFFYYL